jgi:hypothetical protein
VAVAYRRTSAMTFCSSFWMPTVFMSSWPGSSRRCLNIAPTRTWRRIHSGRSPSARSGSRAGRLANVQACISPSSSSWAATAAIRSTTRPTTPLE